MKNIQLSNPTTNDLETMRHIWQTAFDSSDMDLFFELYYNQELTLVSKSENKTMATGYLLPVGDLITNDNKAIPTAMIYAVATLPEYRNLGLGGAISKNLINLARDAGYPAVVLRPAQDSLFDFYSLKTDMKEWFYANEYKLKTPFSTKGHTELSEISPKKYMHLREKLLHNIPHIRYNQHALEYQKKFCELYGGGLFQIKTPIGDSCAVIERQNNSTIRIKELIMPNTTISPDNYLKTIQNIVAKTLLKFPAIECIVRTPATHNLPHTPSENIHHKTERFAMLSLPPKPQNITKDKTTQPWYGLAFD